MNEKWKLPLLLDGATGTNLMLAGMPTGVCVEQWVVDHPQAVLTLQSAYAKAGSGAVMAPTFEANRYKLAKHGLGDHVKQLNRQLVAISRQAVGEGVLVAADISPTGLFVEPFGDTTFVALTDIYREQVMALKEAGADYIAIETMMSLTESRAALLAAKETGLPVTVSLTVDDNCRTLSGGSIAATLLTLAAMGADAVGVNCSTGPQNVLEALTAVSPFVNLPLIAKPNAGLPVEGKPGVYAISPDEFASYLPKYIALGAGLIGGCCGSTPEHIEKLHETLKTISYTPKDCENALNEGDGILASDEYHIYRLTMDDLIDIKTIPCDDELADNLAELADENAVAVRIHLNEGSVEDFTQSAYLAKMPLVLQSDCASVLESALEIYQGRAILDTDCEINRAQLEALSSRYGAAMI